MFRLKKVSAHLINFKNHNNWSIFAQLNHQVCILLSLLWAAIYWKLRHRRFWFFTRLNLQKNAHSSHIKKMQNIAFIVCVLGVVLPVGLTIYSGGSGSPAGPREYAGTTVFTSILFDFFNRLSDVS